MTENRKPPALLQDYIADVRETSETFGSVQAAPLLVDHAYALASAIEALLEYAAETAELADETLGSEDYAFGYRNALSDVLEELTKELEL
mgnify:CR=1 FL=1